MGFPKCETPSRIDGGEQVTVQDVYKVCVKGRARTKRHITQHWTQTHSFGVVLYTSVMG